jgi:hypothetical protein
VVLEADRWQRLAYLPLDAFERKLTKRRALAIAGLRAARVK